MTGSIQTKDSILLIPLLNQSVLLNISARADVGYHILILTLINWLVIYCISIKTMWIYDKLVILYLQWITPDLNSRLISYIKSNEIGRLNKSQYNEKARYVQIWFIEFDSSQDTDYSEQMMK